MGADGEHHTGMDEIDDHSTGEEEARGVNDDDEATPPPSLSYFVDMGVVRKLDARVLLPHELEVVVKAQHLCVF